MKEKKFYPVCMVLFWYALAHGYRMVHNLFSHDSLLEIVQDDSAWQIALGRFMHPVLIFLRGGLTNPWLITCFALFWIAAAATLVLRLLQIKQPLLQFAATGVMVCNTTLVSTNAAFLQCVDFYALALFLAVLGAWLLLWENVDSKNPQSAKERTFSGKPRSLKIDSKKLLYRLAGVLCIAASMGIYQAYVCVTLTLLMLVFFMRVTETDRPCAYVKRALLCCGLLLCGALSYQLIWKLFLAVFRIWTADTYNGMANLFDYSETSLFGLFVLTYQKTFAYFIHPEVFVTMQFHGRSLSFVWTYLLRLFHLWTALCIVLLTVKGWKKQKAKPWQCLIQILILLSLPLGMNFVCLLSKGMVHTLMIYSFVFFYLFYALLCEKKCEKTMQSLPGKILLLLPLFCVIYSQVIYANQVYLKKNLQEQAAASLMTRIVHEMESTEGYVPGSTAVAFSGYFENSPYLQSLPGFEELLPYGMGETVTTYMGTDYAFLRYELNVPIAETRIDPKDPAVLAMPCYPETGSVAYVGDVLVVKISP